jgi:hypothetical protein
VGGTWQGTTIGSGDRGRTGSNRERSRFTVFDCRFSHVSFSSPLPPLFPPFSLLPITIISNMARGRKGANGTSPTPAADSPSDTATPPRSILPIPPTPPKSRDVVKVNNASLVELKNALDDAIKRVRSILSPAAPSPNDVILLIVPFSTRSF